MKCSDPKWIGYSNNNLTVVGFVFKNKRWMWECKCSVCGRSAVVYPQHVIKGTQKSCSCGKARNARDLFSKHNEKGTRLYGIWLNMRDRCNNENNKRYDRYGRRGIRVCKEWDDFLVFKKWANENGYSDDLTIDRINNDSDYSPDNCRWVAGALQARNRSNNSVYEIDGERKSLAEWCEIYNMPYFTVFSRVKKYGWDIERALKTPSKGRGANGFSYK